MFLKVQSIELSKILVLGLYTRTAKILGILAIDRASIVPKVYIFLLMMTILLVNAFLGNKKIFITESKHIFHTIIKVTDTIVVVSIFMSNFVNNMKHIEESKNLFKSLDKLDEQCKNQSLVNGSNSIWRLINFCLVLISTPMIFYYEINTFSSTFELKSILLYQISVIPTYLGFFYSIFLTGFMYEVCHVFETRYYYLKNTLKISCSEYEKIVFQQKMYKLKYCYKLLYYEIQKVNSIFGSTLLFVIVHNITLFLTDFYYIIYNFKDTVDAVKYIVYPCILIVSILIYQLIRTKLTTKKRIY